MSSEKFQSVVTLAKELQLLDSTRKRQFVRAFFTYLPDKQKFQCLEEVFKTVYGQDVYKLKTYLDGIFEKSKNTTPVAAARFAKYYFKFKPVMMPYLIKQAQRAKDRVSKRLKRKTKQGVIKTGRI